MFLVNHSKLYIINFHPVFPLFFYQTLKPICNFYIQTKTELKCIAGVVLYTKV